MLVLSVLAVLLYVAESKINAQMFCDNFCKVYYNGVLVLNDEVRGRTVDVFSFDSDVSDDCNSDSSSSDSSDYSDSDESDTTTRTFAVMLLDNPYDDNEGIWNYESPTFLNGQTDSDGNDIQRQFCLGDGGFRAIFTDDECGDEVVVSSDEWKCEYVISGPRDIEACFENWDEDHTPITYGGPDNIYKLYDPCIRSSVADFGPDYANPDCIQDFNADFINFATSWYSPDFDDSAWVAATTYTEEAAVPKLGRSATQLLTECNEGQYCDRTTYPLSSWGDSQFIWSDKIELDNVVVCRYQYESSCSD